MDQTEIGKFIAKCRKEKGLTQVQLAERLGITDRAVSKWETGKSLPDASVMLELSGILGITVNELLSGKQVGTGDYEKKADENLVALKRKDESSRAKGAVISILYSATLFIGIMVCLICDLAISKGLTWSPIPVSSIVYVWIISFPVMIFGKRGVRAGLVLLTVFTLPYLLLLGSLVKVREVFSVGAWMAAVGILFLWVADAVFRRMGKARIAAAFGIIFLSAVPFLFFVNILLSKLIAEPVLDVWDVFTIFILLILAFAFLIYDHSRKMKSGGGEDGGY